MRRCILFVLGYICIFSAYLTYTQYNPTPFQAPILNETTYTDAFNGIEFNDQISYRWLFQPLQMNIPAVTTPYRIVHIIGTSFADTNMVVLGISASDPITIPIQGQLFRKYQVLLSDNTATSLLQANGQLTITPETFQRVENRRISLAIHAITVTPIAPTPIPSTWAILIVSSMFGIVLVFSYVSTVKPEHFFWLCIILCIYSLTIVQIISISMAVISMLSMGGLYGVYRFFSPVYTQLQDTFPAATPITYRGDIDGLRALAVVAVVIYHAFPDLVPGGFIGVDIFFIISGYLITRIIIEEISTGHFRIQDFYVRRIRRIFPALITVIITTALIGYFILYRSEYLSLGTHILAGAGFVANIILYQQVDYFSDLAINQPLLHLWSLGIEEQFYIFWPIVLWLAARKPRLLIPSIIVLLVASFLIYMNTITSNPAAAFYLLPSRFWQLGIGGLTAILTMFTPPSTSMHWRYQAVILPAIGLILYVYGIFSLDESVSSASWNTIIPSISGVLLVLPHTQNWISHRLLSHPLCIYIGKISFPLYLWHWPLLSIGFMTLSSRFTSVFIILTIILSTLFAAITTHFIERPVRFSHVKLIPTSALLIIMVVIGSLGWAIQTQRLTAFLPDWERLRVNQMVDAQSCVDIFGFTTDGSICTLRSGDISSSEYIIIGDSHAGMITRGMLAVTNNQVSLFAQNGCLPTIPTPCDGNKQLSIQHLSAYLRTHPTRHTHRYIVLAGRYTFAGKKFEDGLRNSFAAFSGVPRTTIIFFHQVPEQQYSPQNCARLSGLLGTPSMLATDPSCQTPTTTVAKQFQRYQSAVQRVLMDFPEIQQFTANTLFCDQQRCLASIDEQIAYQDKDHLNTWGDIHVARLLVQQFP